MLSLDSCKRNQRIVDACVAILGIILLFTSSLWLARFFHLYNYSKAANTTNLIVLATFILSIIIAAKRPCPVVGVTLFLATVLLTWAFVLFTLFGMFWLIFHGI